MIVKCLQKATVLWNRQESRDCYCMGFQCDKNIDAADPGQFVMVRLKGQKSPFLRRPFSIHGCIVESGRIKGFEILYKVVGDTTAQLAACGKDQDIDILGPLGKGFCLPQTSRRVCFVSGGIGVAPFAFLADRMQANAYDLSRVTVFLGGRTKDDLLCIDRFERAGMTLRLTTDDGSAGEKALVTESLEAHIIKDRPDMIYACGPELMLKKVVSISKHYDIPCQVSIETMMACGMGACLGCAVEGKSVDRPYLHACVDGPVFDAGEIIL